jgi:hypothetical protein
MSVITVNGQQVDVGDEYDKLSPADQQATQDDIARQLGHHETAQAQQASAETANQPTGPMDISNGQSDIRKYAIDPALAVAGPVAQFAENHPLLAAGGATALGTAASKIPVVGPALANGLSKVGGAFVPQSVKNLASGATAFADLGKTYLDVRQQEIAQRAQAAEQLHQRFQQKAGMNLGQQAFGQMANELGGQAPVPGAPAPMAPPPPPPVGGPAAQQADSFLSSIASKYGQVANKVAPVLNRVAPALEGAGKMLAPAMIAKELFYTSPEEQAQLKQMEQSHTGLKDWVNDHLFSQKQDLEKQQLVNKHATEMHKYIQAKQKMGNQQ